MKKNPIFKPSAATLPWLYFLFLLFATGTNAQSLITGTVTDNAGTLPGVTITLRGTTASTLTDESGRFSIAATPADILVFSYVGYVTVEKPLGTATVLNIVLQQDTNQLKEVIVNAGYYSVTDRERTGSIARITAKDIETQPVTNVLATMQGRMAGVDIIQDSGTPGGAFSIRIRGRNSLRADGNEPLYIIDGVPYSSETIGGTSTSGDNPSLTSPLNAINPDAIESIEVLKDADATAIYGSRGANGVVLITTKKGKAGKAVFTLNTSRGVGNTTRLPKLMKTPEYLRMREEAFANDGFTDYPASQYDINGTWDPNRNTDWQKELIGGTAEISLYQASVAGGSERTQYTLGGNYRTETTVFPGDFVYRKGAAHFALQHTAEDGRFSLGFSASYVAQANDLPARDLTSIARRLAPNAPALYDGNGELNWENNTFENPLAPLVSTFEAAINDLAANAMIGYRLTPGLQFRTSLGYTALENDERKIQPHTRYNPSFGLGSESSSITNSLTTRKSWIAEPQLDWKLRLGESKLQLLAGSTFQQQVTNRLFLSGNGFSSNSLISNLAAANAKFINLDDEIVYRYQAFFARVNWNFGERYILNLTGRRDGSSRFGPGKQFATFGAVGAAWILSNEAFLAGNPILGFAKLRASYGITGSDQLGDYQFLDTYTSTGIPYQGLIGLQPTRLFNPDFGWEKNTKVEVALETGFLKDRLNLGIAWYQNRSSSQLVGIPLPAITGFTALSANLEATVQNTGLEVTLRSENIRTGDFSWSTGFNIAANRNRLLEFPGLESSTYANTFIVGQPVTITRLYHYTGTNPETGTYEFEDSNGDGTITANGDRKRAVDLSPKFFGGIDNQLRYKNVSLDFLFQFVKQEAMGNYPGPEGTFVNQLEGAATATAQPLTVGINAAANTGYARYALSDAAIEDASYIRLKNIALSYDLPLKAYTNLKCQLYIQGQNVLTFTSFKHGDPEFKQSTMYLPPLRVFSAGVKMTF
ncbi:SusC/RagA family TonB-linked outer membrane protein [Flavobacterium soli]|uniref:SusC/RagA family TonB-linked outer membrane protein n=1 Tax=Flavobacterium soli TaxID=344881 RepID=UPI0004290F1D|nr:SusC/RagA family TonB-linked outer membrane protein [Flavobacterium soli]